MKVVLQRVKSAAVSIEKKRKSAIGAGFLLLVAVDKKDNSETVMNMALKINKLRVFADEHGKMNLDISRVRGKILSVPQFTLLGNTEKGNRPGFDAAADPSKAKVLWKEFNEALRSGGIHVAEGEFGRHMEVSLVNDGPVTLVIG